MMGEWQPIETAPINQPILLAIESSMFDLKTGQCVDAWYVWPAVKALFYRKRKPIWVDLNNDDVGNEIKSGMRFWMPLPAPPTGDTK